MSDVSRLAEMAVDTIDHAVSEESLAILFAQLFPDVRWVESLKKFFIWTGSYYREDNNLRIMTMLRAFMSEVSKIHPDHARRLGSAKTVYSVQLLLRAAEGYAEQKENMDSDKFVLNTPRGVWVFKLGQLLSSCPHRFLTKSTSVAPTSGKMPIFESFLIEVTGNSEALIAYLQRCCGYLLTGSVNEHILLFFYGTGRNGKGVLISVLLGILGTYGTVIPAEMLLESRGERHPTEMTLLDGIRVAVCQEISEGKKFNEARIKGLTSSDPFPARVMRGNFYTVYPTGKIVIVANHKPNLRHVDEAIRSRLHLIPFTVTIPKESRDPELSEKLVAEYPQILQWMLDGFQEYQRMGLNPPRQVLDATKDYFDAEDELQGWLVECCDTNVGGDDRESPSSLFASWSGYCRSNGLNPGTQKTFGQKLEGAGYESGRTGTGRYWRGIKLKKTSDLLDGDAK